MKRMNTIVVFLFILFAIKAQSETFDVTKYGAQADENKDISQILMKTWGDACAASGISKVYIPKGIYALRQVDLVGPCKGSIIFQLDGTLKAPSNPDEHLGDTWVKFRYIDFLTIMGSGTFDGQGEIAWKKNNCWQDAKCKTMPMSLRFDFITNSIVQDITSLNSKNFHINVLGCKNLTFQHVTITAPGNSANTDGIHIGRSDGVNILNTKIATGDDCISIGDGSQKITITEVTCGPGHGISVGSLGKYPNEEPVNGIYVKKCTISGTTNGVRIKSWPALHAGTASEMYFEDVTMNNVSNPVLIDQMYCPWNQCNNKAPSKVKISNVGFKNIKGTSATPLAVQLSCSSGIPCENVELSNIDLSYSGNEGPAKSECTNVKPKITGKLNPSGC